MNINEHPIYKNIYDLCQEIEKLPASEQATKIVVMASELEKPVRELLNEKNALIDAIDSLKDFVEGKRDDCESITQIINGALQQAKPL